MDFNTTINTTAVAAKGLLGGAVSEMKKNDFLIYILIGYAIAISLYALVARSGSGAENSFFKVAGIVFVLFMILFVIGFL